MLPNLSLVWDALTGDLLRRIETAPDDPLLAFTPEGALLVVGGDEASLWDLERGTLQYQLFDNPDSTGQKFLRAFVGGFLRLPPVKKALLSNMLRSRFLSAMRKGARLLGKDWAINA